MVLFGFAPYHEQNSLKHKVSQTHEDLSVPLPLLLNMLAITWCVLQDYRNPGSMGKQYFLGMENALGGSGDPAYPGGQFFNMFNLGSTNMDRMKLREIKNGRLAMLAMLGYFIQAIATGKGPYENLLDHLSGPTANNFLSNLGSIGGSF